MKTSPFAPISSISKLSPHANARDAGDAVVPLPLVASVHCEKDVSLPFSKTESSEMRKFTVSVRSARSKLSYRFRRIERNSRSIGYGKRDTRIVISDIRIVVGKNQIA